MNDTTEARNGSVTAAVVPGLQIEPLWGYVAPIFAVFYPFFLPLSLAMVVFVVTETSLREKPRFVLLASQLVADVVFLGASTVQGLVVSAAGGLPLILCAFNFLLVASSLQAGRLNLGVMALDRYLAIRWPLRYPSFTSPSRVLATVLAIWGSSTSVFVFIYVAVLHAKRHMLLDPVSSCAAIDEDSATFAARKAFVVLCMVLGVSAIVFSYINIVLTTPGDDGAGPRLNQAARRTVLLHALQMALYLIPALAHQLLEVLVQRQVLSLFHVQALGTVCVVGLTLAQCVIPVFYGLRSETMRRLLRRRLGRIFPTVQQPPGPAFSQ
ncbi:odorant receptor 131-2-like [Ambystoma mexicanum]|uniref:odorant receptor 131-2-like n=1 Tax=Ambystoma mexicanum TaxID=8296 RepID=UPI0037E8EA2E